MRFSMPLAALAIIFAVSGPARADTQSDLDQCKFAGVVVKNADPSIAACDRLLKDPKITGTSRAAAFSNRCGWLWAKKDPDHALSDCNEAIKVDPNYAAAYINRGNAYLNKSDFDHAFAKCSSAGDRSGSRRISVDRNRGGSVPVGRLQLSPVSIGSRRCQQPSG